MGYKYEIKFEVTDKNGNTDIAEYTGVSNEYKPKNMVLFSLLTDRRKADAMFDQASRVISYNYKLL